MEAAAIGMRGGYSDVTAKPPPPSAIGTLGLRGRVAKRPIDKVGAKDAMWRAISLARELRLRTGALGPAHKNQEL